MSATPTTTTELGFEVPTSNRYTKKPRPQKDDPFIIDRITKEFAKKLQAWAQDNCPIEDYEDTVREELLTAWELDGYHLAKTLDNKGWNPDAGLVEILDGFRSFKDHVYFEEQAAWVAGNNIQLLFQKDQKVVCKFEVKGKPINYEATIRSVQTKTAQYYVNAPQAGHSPQQIVLVNQEDITANA